MTEIQKYKQGPAWKVGSLNIGICLSAVFLVGCLEFVILDTKLQGRAKHLRAGPDGLVFQVIIQVVANKSPAGLSRPAGDLWHLSVKNESF
jgi:hypothetical protein